MAHDSSLKPLIDFTRRLTPYLAGIFASDHHRLDTRVLEGVHNRIKVIKRMTYG